MLHYLWSVDLSIKLFSIDYVNIYLFSIFFPIDSVQYLSFLNIFFNRFCLVDKCGVTPHFLYRGSLTLKKIVNLETFSQLACFIFVLNTWRRLRNYVKCQNIEVWRRLGQVMDKSFFLETTPDKIHGRSH